MGVASVSSRSSAGDNGMGTNVVYTPEFLLLHNQVNPKIEPGNLKVQVRKARIQASLITFWRSIGCVKHRFVTLEVYSALLSTFYVTAELNRTGANGVINVRITPSATEVVEETEIDLKLYQKKVPHKVRISEVIAVLVNHSSDYNIVRDNCYQYADDMFRVVVEKFGIEVVRSKEMKAELQRALDDHEPPVLLQDVFNDSLVAGEVVGTVVLTWGSTTVALATASWPLTLVGLNLAPRALCLTAGAITLIPFFFGKKEAQVSVVAADWRLGAKLEYIALYLAAGVIICILAIFVAITINYVAGPHFAPKFALCLAAGATILISATGDLMYAAPLDFFTQKVPSF